jgi:folate-binding protein YgfZ
MDFPGMTEGYRALREGAALIDLSGRCKIRATGEDRVRLLHAMTTNHVEQLAPGQGCYAFFLNAQGRILADVNLLCFEDHFLLDTEPETREKVFAHLDKYIIADDVTIEDVTGQIATIGLEGPRAGQLLASLGAPAPAASHETAAWNEWTVARLSASGAEGYWIMLPAPDKEVLTERLRQAGAAAAGASDIRTVRLEHGRPRYGEDLTEKYIANEAQVTRALHFNKGCYLGQEIVERVRSRGQIHRRLVRLKIRSVEPPAPGAELTAEDKVVGEITSAAYSPAAGAVVALGYVRDHHAREGNELRLGDAVATVVAAQPA